MTADTRSDSRFRALHAVFVAGLPILVLIAWVTASVPKATAPVAHERAALLTSPVQSVALVLIVDSMGRAQAEDAGLMPNLVALAGRSLSGPMQSCFANMTLPCLLTAFEGRQSPFLTALQNFSASASSNPSWFEALRQTGRRVALLSDHTLPELYPGLYVEGGSYEEHEVPIEERDRWAYARGREWLAARGHDVIVLHVVNTDKMTHEYHPGAPEYRRAFAEADAFIGEATRMLRPQDSLVIFGDHGHEDGGHHTTDAWYLCHGPRFAPGRASIDQTSLLFLLSRIHDVVLPGGYEGELPWDLVQNDPDETEWRAAQAAAWGAPFASARSGLDGVRAERAAARARQPREQALAFLPWVLHLLLLTAAVAAHLRRERRLVRGFVAFQLLWLAVAMTGRTWAVWAALPIQLGLCGLPWAGWLGVPALTGALGLAAISGLAIPWVVGTFHVRSGVSVVIPLWFAAVVGVPALLGAVLKPAGPPSRLAQAGLVALAAAALYPAPGVYYYGVAQSISHVLFAGAALGIAFDARPSGWRGALLAAAFLLGGTFTLMQAGGWDFRYIPQIHLASWPILVQVGLAGALLACTATIWWRAGHGPISLLPALVLAGAGWALIVFFGLESWRVAGFAVLCLSLTAGLRLLGKGDPARTAAWQIALVLGVAYVALWSASDGFFLKNLRFEFALHLFAHTTADEAELAQKVTLVVMAKYALVVLIPLTAAGMALGAARLTALAPWLVLFGALKLVAQALQTLGVSFVVREKSSELLIQETIGVAFLLLVLWVGLSAVALYRRGVEWALGRERVATAERIE